MSLYFSRAVVRQQQLLSRRAAFRSQSTTSEAATKAKEAAGQVQSKASEGLSRVQSSAGSAINTIGSAAGSAMNALGSIGGPIGRLVNFVQSLVPPTVHYSRVGLELGKIIFEGRKMSPPSSDAFQLYFRRAFNALRNPSSLLSSARPEAASQNVLHQVRNIGTQDLVGVGVVLAEVIGFFSVGEMLGRFKIVGYRSSNPHKEH